MSEWRRMSDNPFPWRHKDVILSVFARDDPTVTELFR